ncbi:hypothetical protein [Geosporobacter ferrireducens]|nr:hypothetical protein [Geosporobacter ferrireducens]
MKKFIDLESAAKKAIKTLELLAKELDKLNPDENSIFTLARQG